MTYRVESRESMPPLRQPKWAGTILKIRDVEIGKCLVVKVEKEMGSFETANIEKYARRHGLRVKARKRGQEIWIERLQGL